ncbi:MAG: ThiF family adenylyltransferase [Minisyncoccia bacterium]|jgi:molybdopterin/thiamine biosynthesis adenylyltransferase
MKEIIDRDSWKPVLVKRGQLEEIIKSSKPTAIIDQYLEMLDELFLIKNPRYCFDNNYKKHLTEFRQEHFGKGNSDDSGSWFYFPWHNQLVHYLPEAMHQELRTGRNCNLITKEEQGIFYNSTIGILGLSVGSHAAITAALTGGGKNLRLADPDTISGSNTNRIRVGFQNIGLSKVRAVARQIYEINPYSNISIYPEGVTEQNIESIILGEPRVDVLIEEMDNPYYKFKAREILKKYKIPLIAAADNGDGVIAHIERYDTDKNLKPFNGLMGNMTAEQVKKLGHGEMVSVVARTVGADRSVLRMQKSVMEVGKTLYSWPQLGTAANLCGSVLAYLARKVILKTNNIKSGVYDVSLDSILESDWHSKKNVTFRKKRTGEFLRKIGINGE